MKKESNKKFMEKCKVFIKTYFPQRLSINRRLSSDVIENIISEYFFDEITEKIDDIRKCFHELKYNTVKHNNGDFNYNVSFRIIRAITGYSTPKYIDCRSVDIVKRIRKFEKTILKLNKKV